MPLRDHFRPPVSKRSSWEGFHGGWPMTIVQQLVKQLPENYTAEPRAHLGATCEVEVGTFEEVPPTPASSVSDGNGGVATATWAPPQPTLTVETDLLDQDEYEVRIYDQDRARLLVAAIELVSPANKDRPENRRIFVRKCAALLQQDVCVSIVDVVTTRNFNLYVDLLAEFDCEDPRFQPDPSAIYAVTCRGQIVNSRMHLQTWAIPLIVGNSLPTLPVWLSQETAVSLELDFSYEETCRAIRIADA